MTPPVASTWPSAPIARLFAAALGLGSAVGGGMGMFTAVAIFGGAAVFAAGPAAVVGAIVGLQAASVLGAVIVAIAGVRHRPLRDPLLFQRDLWIVFVLAAALILAGATALLSGEADPRTPFLIPAGVLVLLLMLRSAGRHLVVVYARAYGWTVGGPPNVDRPRARNHRFDELPATRVCGGPHPG
jgi:hypothetical protein